MFFDLEGDPFVGERGLEYLFGYAYVRAQRRRSPTATDWAFSRESEKAAFERFVDFVIARLKTYPDLHIYHYAPYEPAALKRLMGRYASREEEIDFSAALGAFRRSLQRRPQRACGRASRAIRSSGSSRFTVMRATIALPDANRRSPRLQAHLELDDSESIADADLDAWSRATISDDCLSTLRLRDWLEGAGRTLIADGRRRPASRHRRSGRAEREDHRAAAENQRAHRATDGGRAGRRRTSGRRNSTRVGSSPTLSTWHRREEKAVWWEYLPAARSLGRRAIRRARGPVGIDLCRRRPAARRRRRSTATAFRRRRPNFAAARTSAECRGGRNLARCTAISIAERWVEIKKRKDTAEHSSRGRVRAQQIGAQVLANSLERIGDHVADHGMEGDGPYLAARDLLMRAPPPYRWPADPE